MKKLPIYTLSLLLCLGILLPGGGQLAAQPADTSTEEPGFFQRFINIFKPSKVSTDTLTPSIPDSMDLTKQFPIVYNLIHQEQQAYYQSLADSNYLLWDEINDLENAKYISPNADSVILSKNMKVFGWHPHWMGNAYKHYPYELLSHVALFSYNVNTGSGAPFDNKQVMDIWESKDFNIVELAHEANCKVMLTVTNFGRSQNIKFLSDTSRQINVINDVVDRMIAMDADGIDIDFELIPENYEKKFSEFIMRLHDRLSNGGSRYQLSVVLPKVNGSPEGNKIYNIKLLQEYVDFFTLTAYDFTTGDYQAGAIAPLYNKDLKRRGHSSIEDVVFNYLEDSLDRSKLLLGLPYYGGKWTKHTRSNGPDSLSFQHLTYAAIRNANRQNGPPEYVPNVWAAKYMKKSAALAKGFDYKEEITWFDDSLTLTKKYDWVLEQRLGGVGIWALGYDMPNTELWGLIGEKFASKTDTLVFYEPSYSAWHLPTTISKYGNLIAVSGLFIFAFLTIGFVAALFDWRVRDVFYREKTLRFLYIVASFALFTATLAIVLFLKSDLINSIGTGTLALVSLVGGLVVGALLVWVISRRFAAGRKMAP